MQTYTIKPASAEDFFSAFMVQAAKIQGEPTYDDIRHLRTTIYQNAASVPSANGGGNHGHLGMVMDATTYASLTQTVWTDPPEPPVAPTIPAGATGPNISEAHRAHAQALKERREFQNLDRALLRLVVEAVEPLYIEPFHRPYIGLLGQTTKEILLLLMTNYGNILPHELERNYMQLNTPYDATAEPFQVLLGRYDSARTFAQDGNLPISDAQLINSGLVALKNTGVLDRFIDLWTDKPPANRATWLQFKEHFQPRVLEYQKGRRTGAGQQYGLVAAQRDQDSMPQANDLLMQVNHAAMVNMAATQTELLKQLADMQEKFATLVAAGNQQGPRRGGGRTERSRTSNQAANHQRYCHTHGYNVAVTHTSQTCRFPGPNHQKEATRGNTMNGSEQGKPGTPAPGTGKE